jgi:hypothetical protein
VSDKILAVIDPEGDVKEQLQSIRDNFLTLQKDSLKGAAQVLALTALGSNVSVTATTDTSIGLKTSITTSGGLIFLFAVCKFSPLGTNTTTMRLTLDGVTQAQASESRAAGYAANAALVWAGAVGSGLHVIDAVFSVDTSNTTVSGSSTPETYLVAVEFII